MINYSLQKVIHSIGNIPFFKSSRQNKLAANAGIYLVAIVIQKAAAFLLIPLYTRFLLPSDYGIVGLAQSTQHVLALLIGFGLNSAIARFYYDYKNDEANLRSYVTTNYLFLVLTSIGITLLLDRFGGRVWDTVTTGQIPFSPYIRLAIWLAFADASIQIPLTLFRTAQQAIPFVVSQLSIFFLSTTAIVYLIVFRKSGAVGILIGDLTANVIIDIILIAVIFHRYATTRLKISHIKNSLKYSLPIVPHLVARWALVALDRFVLERSGISLNQIGLYNLAYQLSTVMNVILLGFTMAWTPYYFDVMKENRSPELVVRKVLVYFMATISIICMIGTLFSPELIGWLTTSRYYGAERFLPLILYAYLFQGLYHFFVLPLLFYKQTRYLPMITGIAVVSGLIINIWGVPKWGAITASWATMISYGISLALAFIWGRRYQKLDLPYVKIAVILIIALAVSVWVTYTRWNLENPNLLLLIIKIVLGLVFTYIVIFWLVLPSVKQNEKSSNETQI